jgi:hypothetical protein
VAACRRVGFLVPVVVMIPIAMVHHAAMLHHAMGTDVMTDGLRPQMSAFRRAVVTRRHIMGVSGLLPQDSRAGMMHRAMMVKTMIAVALRGCSASETGHQGAKAAQRQAFCE